MTKKRRPDWAEVVGDKPIERVMRRDDPRHGEAAQDEAFAEQFRRICRIKESYGIEGVGGWRPWYDLAVALASERTNALTIIDPRPAPTGIRARKWAGAEGIMLIQHVNVTWQYQRDEQRKAGKPEDDVTLESVFTELKEWLPFLYGGMSNDELRSRLSDAEKYHPEYTKQRKK